MAEALRLIDALLSEVDAFAKNPSKSLRRTHQNRLLKQGYIYLTSENLKKKFVRPKHCKLVVLDTQFEILCANFDEIINHLYELFSEIVMNLQMQKQVFGGEKLKRVENTIEELESIIDGEKPQWRLAFFDPSERTQFEGEVHSFKIKQDVTQSTEDVKRAAEIISKSKNILLLNGAGLSVAAGIPDFRSSDGLYNQLDLASLPGMTPAQLEKLKSDKQWVFHADMFKQNPMVYFTIREKFFTKEFQPTFSHYVMAKLVESGKVRKIYTQNIDGLLRKTGISEEKIVEVHGTLATARCNVCGAKANMKQYNSDLKAQNLPPTCPICGGPQRPDTVFFGESLPTRYHEEVLEDCKHCDLLIVTGTSLLVGPVNQMVCLVPDDCPRLLINRDRVGMHFGMFISEHSSREDLFWCGDADDGFRILADSLGWTKDMKA